MMLTAARIHQFSHLYVLPVLRMTSRFHIIERMGENRIRPVFFFQFATVAAQGEKSAVSEYILFFLQVAKIMMRMISIKCIKWGPCSTQM